MMFGWNPLVKVDAGKPFSGCICADCRIDNQDMVFQPKHEVAHRSDSFLQVLEAAHQMFVVSEDPIRMGKIHAGYN